MVAYAPTLIAKIPQLHQALDRWGLNFSRAQIHDHLLLQTFVHKSYASDFKEPLPHNERLEFLGDGILGAVINSILYRDFPDQEESVLTLYKIALVREENLALVSKKLGIDELMILGNGEERSGGRTKNVILADMLEAVIGYLYLELGRNQTFQFVQDMVYIELDRLKIGDFKSYKTKVQELIQKESKSLPEYHEVEELKDSKGNVTIYRSELRIQGELKALGKGPSKKKAQEEAAKNYYTQIIGK